VFQLHKAPRFLIDLLRLRTQGGQPNQFGSQVIPIVDTTRMYGADMQLSSSAASGATAVPATVTFTIVNEATYLAVAGEFTVGAAAGTFAALTIGYRSSASSVFVPLYSERIVPTAGRSYFYGGQLRQPIVARAGAQFLSLVQSDAGGADHVVDLRMLSEDPIRQ